MCACRLGLWKCGSHRHDRHQAVFNKQDESNKKHDDYDAHFVKALNAIDTLTDEMMERIEALEARLEKCAAKSIPIPPGSVDNLLPPVGDDPFYRIEQRKAIGIEVEEK